MKPKSVPLTVRINPESKKILYQQAERLAKPGERAPVGRVITQMIEYFDTDDWDDIFNFTLGEIEDEIAERKRRDRERKRKAKRS
jgi:hypothetical protein